MHWTGTISGLHTANGIERTEDKALTPRYLNESPAFEPGFFMPKPYRSAFGTTDNPLKTFRF